jgi:hypothetical protein
MSNEDWVIVDAARSACLCDVGRPDCWAAVAETNPHLPSLGGIRCSRRQAPSARPRGCSWGVGSPRERERSRLLPQGLGLPPRAAFAKAR